MLFVLTFEYCTPFSHLTCKCFYSFLKKKNVCLLLFGLCFSCQQFFFISRGHTSRKSIACLVTSVEFYKHSNILGSNETLLVGSQECRVEQYCMLEGPGSTVVQLMFLHRFFYRTVQKQGSKSDCFCMQ